MRRLAHRRIKSVDEVLTLLQWQLSAAVHQKAGMDSSLPYQITPFFQEAPLLLSLLLLYSASAHVPVHPSDSLTRNNVETD